MKIAQHCFENEWTLVGSNRMLFPPEKHSRKTDIDFDKLILNLCFNNQFGTFKKTFTKLMIFFDKYIIPLYVYREHK